jgi:hypothetical protein
MSIRKGKDETEPYVKLDNRMTNSAAWTALGDGAVWLYIELKKQFNFKKGGYDHLVLPYSKVAWRMSRGTYCNRLQELIQYGFIRIVEPGGLQKRATVYALSSKWEDKSREIVDQEGREAIRLGLAKKPSSKDNISNLIGKRTWEKR